MRSERVTGGSADAGVAGRLLTPKVIAGLVIAALALVFVFQNSERGRIHFLFFTVTARAWIWLLAVFGAGIVVGLLLPRMRRGKD